MAIRVTVAEGKLVFQPRDDLAGFDRGFELAAFHEAFSLGELLEVRPPDLPGLGLDIVEIMLGRTWEIKMQSRSVFSASIRLTPGSVDLFGPRSNREYRLQRVSIEVLAILASQVASLGGNSSRHTFLHNVQTPFRRTPA